MKFLKYICIYFLLCQVSAKSVEDENSEVSLDDVVRFINEYEENSNKSITHNELEHLFYIARAEIERMWVAHLDHYAFCEKKLNVTDEEISARSSNPPEKIKCLLTCALEKSGAIRESGPLVVLKKITDITVQKFGYDKENEYVQNAVKINQCFYQPSQSECDEIFKPSNCLFELIIRFK